MYIKICDRCGKQTNNKPAFLIPVDRENGSLNIGGVWFGEDVGDIVSGSAKDQEDAPIDNLFTSIVIVNF